MSNYGQKCYQCGAQIRDDYPSHFCIDCRKHLTDPVGPLTFEQRLTQADKDLLAAMLITY